MMMAKPAETSKEEDDAPPAFAAPPKLTQVQQLEKQLEMLGGMGSSAAPAPEAPVVVDSKPASIPVAAAPPAATKPAAPTAGGKKDLLVSFKFAGNMLSLCNSADD